MLENRLPTFDDMGYDPDETPRRIIIPTEPGESIEVPTNNFLTDCTGIMPPDAV